MNPLIVIVVVVLVVALGAAAFFIRRKNQQANIARADQLRQQAASQAQATIAPAQERAAEAEAQAEEARARAERAEREAQEARLEAQQVEASHEGQVRAADRLDPRVDHTADDYAPQVPGTVDQRPTPPAEVNAEHEPQAAPHSEAAPAPQAEAAPTPETTTRDEAPAAEPTAEPAAETAPETAAGAAAAQPAGEADGNRAPLLPRRTPGSNDMPGKPIEKTDGGGGWFTKGSDQGSDRA